MFSLILRSSTSSIPKISKLPVHAAVANFSLRKGVVSEALLPIIGESEISRADGLKKLWDYIKINSLQDPEKKSIINADKVLADAFGQSTFTTREVLKLIGPHIIYPPVEKEPKLKKEPKVKEEPKVKKEAVVKEAPKGKPTKVDSIVKEKKSVKKDASSPKKVIKGDVWNDDIVPIKPPRKPRVKKNSSDVVIV
eukprot:CAMPEP_0170126188 /NCGR_PEP_ID=MMETSP0020_2-20130122/19525_1 /TAXON_ID=98059 /ORGANISM="Dinobryon sp., Strain UTEXLB2267" /LENGTH=194 /DNA_ID=CAMNT_0010359067 /DNA_START=59 /DNA_END=643 /DNA_ORIENTATION=+